MKLSKDNAVEVLSILKSLLNINEVSKLHSTFITAFKDKSILKEDGKHYLHGSFNLGGTVSGRMSSSDPNMHNMPSTGSQYAKKFKECFEAPDGWVIVGADFSSLEDRISALTTRDPNKLKVYTDGYDGHCLRAHAYFGTQMPDILSYQVSSINSIENKYPNLRQDSKPITFALTYLGTYYTLVRDLGLEVDVAKEIEANFHKLYAKSTKWVQQKLAEASRRGYVEVAFGLRVRTPLLASTLLNKRTTPREAQSESRTAGNALGQSWGLLNNRSANEFMDKVYTGEYRYDVLPIQHIHDSQYYLVKKDPKIIAWVNQELIKSMQWQEHPDIMHDQVTLEAELELLYPDMSKATKIKNNASVKEVTELLDKVA